MKKRYSDTQLERIRSSLASFEGHETDRRRLEAEQLSDLASAMDAAVGDDVPGQSDRELGYRSLRLELAALLHESEGVAERLLQAAHAAQQFFPSTLAALNAGQISLNHLKVITNEGAPLTAGDGAQEERRRTAYEAEVLRIASEESPNRLRPIARRLAASQLEESLTERHEREVARRYVRVVDAADGMADLTAYLPAEEAYAIYDRLTRTAKRLTAERDEATPGGPVASGSVGSGSAHAPSIGEARVDVFRDLLLGKEGKCARTAATIRGQIQVVVPVELLGGAGVSADESADWASGGTRVAELVGHGPIAPATARRLATEADAWERVNVDGSGTVLSVDRYRPTPEMKRMLSARDLHCRAPGCGVPAHRCDIDHTVDAALGGKTSTDNLAHLCRGHHTLKHHSDWQVEQLANGVMKWTSPSGRDHFDRPPSRVRFRPTTDAHEAQRGHRATTQ
ncbi:HNH endonuclease signature motif containing protein [Leucobacter komagatae]|uniref:HNH endonuclease signature motif containing protein n=1 Tax=Leucobacter komagatae TaxID=55969 RepID=UPI0018DE84F2|nr:HNH endonuclease signature motif containing protein [Leucobacter komagatae]